MRTLIFLSCHRRINLHYFILKNYKFQLLYYNFTLSLLLPLLSAEKRSEIAGNVFPMLQFVKKQNYFFKKSLQYDLDFFFGMNGFHQNTV